MLSIIACIKYVRSELVSTSQSDNNYTINPYDLYMLKKFMEIKKSFPCRVVSLTMGPPGCTEAVQRGIALGLDDVYLVSDPFFSGADTYATTHVLNKALDYIGQADIYAFGEKAIDGETGQVPIGVASRLGLQCVTGVRDLDAIEEGKIILKRQFTDCFENAEAFTPCVLCFKGFTTKEPQLSLMKLKQSRKHPPIVLNAKSLNIEKKQCGQDGSKTTVKNIVYTIHKRDVEILEGSPQLKAEAFRKLILEKWRNDY